MRIRMYGKGSVFSVSEAKKIVEGSFLSEKNDLEYKMKRVVRWEKRLRELKDPQMVAKVEKLLSTFQNLCTQHHIKWVTNQDQWSSTLYATYIKDDVTLDLYADLNVNPDKLWANFYSKKNNAMALRIYIGKEVRITNRILQCLLK